MAFVPLSSDGTTNGTSVITVVASPAGGVARLVKNFVLRNADTVPTTLNVNYQDAANTRTIYVIQLAVGDQIQFNQADIQVLDTTNKSITISLAAPKTTNDCPWVAAYADES